MSAGREAEHVRTRVSFEFAIRIGEGFLQWNTQLMRSTKKLVYCAGGLLFFFLFFFFKFLVASPSYPDTAPRVAFSFIRHKSNFVCQNPPNVYNLALPAVTS